jgi:LysM repeat protein
VKDYKGWAKGLKKAGYATNPKYPQLLIKIIEENELYKFDKGITPEYLSQQDVSPATGDETPAITSTAPLPVAANFELVEIWETGRKVYQNNGSKFIFTKAGDTYSDIAADFEIYSWQLPKYNEMPKDAILQEGQMLYIEKKAKKNKDIDTHRVNAGESMHYIAQLYGIQLSHLFKKNGMKEGAKASAGKVLKLN